MSKVISTVLAAVLAAGLIAGCGGKLNETYQMVTIREAGHSQIASPGFKFGFDTPDFIAANGDLALVREGNIIEFFTGIDIENKIKQVEGKKFIVGARKIYSPITHFTVDFFVVGGDTIEVGEPYAVTFPPMIKGFDEGEYEEVDISALSPETNSLKDIFNTKFKVEKAVLTYEEVNWGGTPEMAYVLNYPNIRFFIEEVSPELELVLKAFMAEDLYFDGGVSYGDRPATSTRNYRVSTKIAGPVKLEYIRYAGSVMPVVAE
ncbi:MAG TPA: hypothetical protein ENO08_05615 [Candidatus Eisenbacteria bacterium]|uniref:Uncharacterized protein n=1 Tax=Eiseniibacteriota bacterium TaxID=2212470 RepID=A0A7V2AVA0_UNCEI|nr:hypothetical protein [Candidatus Eisenbacteria bacterium]